MLSLISTTHNCIPNSHHHFSRLSCSLIPCLVLECGIKQRAEKFKKAAVLIGSYGFEGARTGWKFERNLDKSWRCLCRQGEGDAELEAEIMDFMAESEKPTMFPTKKELMRAGRMDLVEAIKERGGWYSLGWDEEDLGDNVGEDFDVGEFHRRVESCKETASLREHYDCSFSGHGKEDRFSSEINLNSGNPDSLDLATSTSLAGSLETGTSEDTGIEGILSRLEKQRNSDFGINLEKNVYEAHARRNDEGDYGHFNTSSDVARTDLGENDRLTLDFHRKGMLMNASNGKVSPNAEPETWRTWINRRAGFQHTEFEAGEISLSNNQEEADKQAHHVGTTLSTEEYAETWEHEEINHNQIRAHLQHLESELNTALRSLRSKREECISEEVTGSSSDLQKLSDALEFQENEIMSAHERLRSIRAKLAVLEGKMALAIIDAQKMVELKQKRIDGARKALQLLRTTRIVWPNPASEVLLAGSFDGWTTQRKMEKSKTGVFSVWLKLYPGRYEIKFIIDGVWKVDPLRPIVQNNGYENNLFIVT